MKKVISLVLAFVLAFACVPVAFATDYGSGSIADGDVLILDSTDVLRDVVIPSGAVVTVKEGASVNIAKGSTVVVNGTLINNGVLNVTEGSVLVVNSGLKNVGKIYNDGIIRNKNNILNGETGVVLTKVIVPDTAVSDPAHPFHVKVASDGIAEDAFFADPEKAYGPVNAGTSRYVVDGESLYFTLDFDAERVDPDKFVVNANGVRVFRDRGAYKITPAGEAIQVTWGDYVEKNLIKKIKIMLPYGEGYRVVAYGTTLEEATEENIEYVYVDYGSELNFRVDVFEGWQDSDITVTIGGLDPSAQADGSYISGPDQYGYYTIRNITDTKAAQGAYEIYVAGVVADKTQNMIMSIFNTVRRIFETIIDMFKTFFGLFENIGGSGSADVTTEPVITTAAEVTP